MPAATRKRELADRGIERRKQLIGDVGVGTGEGPKQRRLARVRVAHQGHAGHRDRGAGAAPGVALLSQLGQLSGQGPNARGQQPAVGFQLRFARAAQADAALLAFQVRPAAHQPRRQVLELRELDLELAFEGAGTLRKNVEYQSAAIEHAPAGQLLEIAFLAGRERVIDQYDVRALGLRNGVDFIRLATAHEIARVGPVPPTGDRGHRSGAGRTRQLLELVEIFAAQGLAEPETHQHRALTGLWALKHAAGCVPALLCGALRALAARKLHGAGGNHGGDGVFVDHLADGVLQ